MNGQSIVSLIGERQNLEQFRRKTWEGTFEEYLDLVRENPGITRNAFQRVYDMIVSSERDVYEPTRGEKRTHYCFFDDPMDNGRDAVFGLDEWLEHLINAIKSAARGYGIEKRVLLLHGPVRSSKSTIARLLKKGLERYCATDEGPAVQQFAGRSQAGHGPRVRSLRLLQEQLLVRKDEPADDRRDGQPRKPDPPLHGPIRSGESRGVHRRVPEYR